MESKSEFRQRTEFFWKNRLNQILLVSLFALATGHAWHIRGSGPWGGMTGMWAVGTIVVLLIFVMFGDRAKATPAMAGIMVVLMAVTVAGWGTLNRQITGRLILGPGYDIPVHPLTGVLYMFLTGFGWAPLFGLALGYFLSDHDYTPKIFWSLCLGFFGAYVLGKAIIAPLVIPITAPTAYNAFAEALFVETGANPWEFFLANYFDSGAMKAITGGRNYEAMANNFGNSFGALILWLLVRFGVKDKKTAKYTIAIPLIIGTSMLVANFWMFWDAGCFYSFETGSYSCTAPDWLQGISWGMWEYFTGFGYGLGLAILLMQENPKTYQQTREISETIIPDKTEPLVEFGAYYGVMLFASIWFPIGTIIRRQDYEIIGYVVQLLAGLIWFALIIAYKKGKFKIPEHSVQKYAFLLLLGIWTTYFVLDTFITPHDPAFWQRVTTHLDILSYVVGVPILLYLYKQHEK